MKDALGHGSNGLTEALRARLSHSSILKTPGSASPKSGTPPVHDAFQLSAAVQRVRDELNPYERKMGQGIYKGGGQALVRAARGTNVKDWSGRPIGDLKGKNH